MAWTEVDRLTGRRPGKNMPAAPINEAEKQRRAKLIADVHGGIFAPYEIYYIGHIQSVSRRCVEAFTRFETQVRRHQAGSNPHAAFDELQVALSHAAAVSRFFWESRKGPQGLAGARAAKLRRAFGLLDASPLKDRALRDAIEHYDERLDEYLLAPQHGNTLDVALSAQPQSAADNAFALRHVNIVGGEVYVLGHRYAYLPIKAEVTRVMLAADSFMDKGCRLPVAVEAPGGGTTGMAP